MAANATGHDAGEVQFLYAPLAPLELPEVEDELPFDTLAEASYNAAKGPTVAKNSEDFQVSSH